MRSGERLRAASAIAFGLACGCGVRLDQLPEGEPKKNAPPRIEGCPLLAASGSELEAVWGRARRVRLPNEQNAAWLLDRVSAFDNDPGEGAQLVRGDFSADGCSASSTELASVWTGAGDANTLTALDAVSPGFEWLYFQNADGFGVAHFDPDRRAFEPAPGLLWSADRPNFGVAAFAVDALSYAYGCRSARFLEADCWLARTDSTDLSDASAYRYTRGGGNLSATLDEAFPLLSAGSTISVARIASRSRYLMAYVEPLGDTISFRSGLSPEGPWSAPVDVARCALPKDAFCGDLALHPDMDSGDEAITLSYAISTFDGDARAARPLDYRTRIVRLPWPAILP